MDTKPLEKAQKLLKDVLPHTGDNPAGDAIEEALKLIRQVMENAQSCEAAGCTYYHHYLVWYDPAKAGERLEHEAYHQAEQNCATAQKNFLDWMNDSANDGKPIPEYLERQCVMWEKRVCA